MINFPNEDYNDPDQNDYNPFKYSEDSLEEINDLYDQYDENYNKKVFCDYDNFYGYPMEEENNANDSTDSTEKKKFENKSLDKSPDSIENEKQLIDSSEINDESDKTFTYENIYLIKPASSTESNILIPKQEDEQSNKENNLKGTNELNTVNVIIKENVTDDNSKTNENLRKKRKRDSEFNTGNIMKNVRTTTLTALISFVNQKIKFFYNNKIGKGLKEKQFQNIDKKNLSHSKVDYDKEFLEFKLKDIFSWDITGKKTSLLPYHNKKLVDILLNDPYCSEYFQKLFDLKFSHCLEHIQGKKTYEILKGLMDCESIFNEFAATKYIKDKEYYSNFKDVLMNYQVFVSKRSPRQSKKKKIN